VDEVVLGDTSDAAWGALRRPDLPALPRSRSRNLAPVAVRLAVLVIVGLVAFKGVQALLFDPLNRASVSQIAKAIREKSPGLKDEQIEQFIQVLRESRGDPLFAQAVEEARKGNTFAAGGSGYKSIRMEKRRSNKYRNRYNKYRENRPRRRETLLRSPSSATRQRD
jgi:hypothetical protein